MKRSPSLLLASVFLLAACSQAEPPPSDNVVRGVDEAPQATAASAVPTQRQPTGGESVAPGEPVEAIVWGNWTVTSARLSNPDGPVQAYGPEQFSELRGTRLTIARDEAGWTGPATVDNTAFAAACSQPQPEAVGDDGVLIRCAHGNVFGPASGSNTWRMVGNDHMVIPWFDGVTLELDRAS